MRGALDSRDVGVLWTDEHEPVRGARGPESVGWRVHGVCLRLVRQFIMDTERLDPHGVTENVREPSPLTGNRGWDALIAGVVEDLAYRHGVRVPKWAMEPERSTDECWWFVSSIPALHPRAFCRDASFARQPRCVYPSGVPSERLTEPGFCV